MSRGAYLLTKIVCVLRVRPRALSGSRLERIETLRQFFAQTAKSYNSAITQPHGSKKALQDALLIEQNGGAVVEKNGVECGGDFVTFFKVWLTTGDPTVLQYPEG